MCELEAVLPTPIRVTGRAASIQFRVRITENETDFDARLLFDQQMFVPVLSREDPLTFHIKKATIFGDYLEIWAICARPLRPCEIDFFRLVEDGQSAAFNLLRQVDLEARAITAFQRVASDLRNRTLRASSHYLPPFLHYCHCRRRDYRCLHQQHNHPPLLRTQSCRQDLPG